MGEAQIVQRNNQPGEGSGAGESGVSGESGRLETIIRPEKGWLAIDFAELWRYRELLFFLIWRDIKVRYKQTVLGAAWAIIQPVFSMIVFSIIFGSFAKIPSDNVPYPIFVYAGLLPWLFFSGSVSQAGMSLVSQANLLTKIYFPRLYVPAASVGTALVDFCLSACVYVCLMLWFMHTPGWPVLLAPVLLLLTIITALGVGNILASLSVTYRDFRYVIPFMLQVWMYGSPVVYSATMIPAAYRPLMAINPMYGIIAAFRSALLNLPVDWMALGISSVVALGLFVFGLYLFRRTERQFADIA